MKPNPFASLNHFTIPVAIDHSLGGLPGRYLHHGASGPILRRQWSGFVNTPSFSSTPSSQRLPPTGRGLEAAPEEVRQPPEHAGGRRPAPRFRAIAHREVGDERRA